jgi:hypothetical protein
VAINRLRAIRNQGKRKERKKNKSKDGDDRDVNKDLLLE